MEIAQIRADVPRRICFAPALIVIGVVAVVAFAFCVSRGGAQETTLPIRSSLSAADDPLTGAATNELLVGERLTQLPTTPSFWFAWFGLFPATDLF